LPEKITTPLKHETLYKYDGNGNLITKTDPEGNVTKYKYDADNELEETEAPNKTTTKTEYDGAGQPIKQTDGNGHATKYNRNVLEQVTEITDPLARKTAKRYDRDGHLLELTDAAKRTTTNVYDRAGRLKETTCSDGKTPTVKYEYNKDGLRTKMVDGTGTSTYEYDEFDRLTSMTDGHGDTVGYEYDLANQQTKLTYPGEKAVTRAYDNAGRLKSVTDWGSRKTSFAYDADGNNTAITFPEGSGNKDTYAYDETDAMSEAGFAKGATTTASIEYTRNKDGQITKAKDKGLPGEETLAYSYDENNRLTKGTGLTYKYDAGNNPTTVAGGTATYDAGNELEKLGTVKYAYDEVGERTKAIPALAANTAYEYNQAGVMTAASKAGSFEDTYKYNGDGLRAAQTSGGTSTYDTWDGSVAIPALLTDGTSSYIYGPEGVPIEEITGSAVGYLHHDAQGSTRLVTAPGGEPTAAATYDAYGNRLASSGTFSTRIGYDGQYTDPDTGLLYLRARYYDPATAQFMSVDPQVEVTGGPYTYADGDPVTGSDPSGEFAAPGGGHECKTNCPPPTKAEITAVILEKLAEFGFPGPDEGVEFESRPTRNGGFELRREGAPEGDNGEIIRYSPASKNREASLRYTDRSGRYVDPRTGKPTSRSDLRSHIYRGYKGPFRNAPKWWRKRH
jgi:RHS repeat-associated protein